MNESAKSLNKNVVCGDEADRRQALAAPVNPGSCVEGGGENTTRVPTGVVVRSRPLGYDDPAGTLVWLVEDNGTVTQTVTRSHVWSLGDGSPVVQVRGRSGGYSGDRISVPTPEVTP